MAPPVKTYGFINAKLRARIGKLLDDSFFAQMVRARSFIECIALLRGTEYGEIDAVYTRTGDLKLGELELYRRELQVLTGIERYVESPVVDVVRALTTRYEIEELKNSLRLWFERVVRGRSVEQKVAYLARERIHYDIPWDEVVNAPTIEDIAEALDGTPYRSIVEAESAEVEARSSLFPLETSLDRYFYRELNRVVLLLGERDRVVAQRLVGMEVDLANLEWVARYKSYYSLPHQEAVARTLPYGYALDASSLADSYESKDPTEALSSILGDRYPSLSALLRSSESNQSSKLAALERFLHDMLLEEVRKILGGYPFTIGIVLSYFVLKQTEIRKLVTILNAKQYDVPEERIGRLI